MNVRREINVIIGDVSFSAPESPEHLDIALRLLEIRRKELEPDAINDSGHTQSTSESNVMNERLELIRSVDASVPSPRRNRWFRDQFPRITLADGSIRTLNSIEELRDLLRRHGLQPHSRGDASMLLWQVRNRLGYSVEPVPVPYSHSL